MKIDGPGPIRPGSVRRTGRAGKTNGASFALPTGGEDAPVSATTAGPSVAGIDALLALQEVPDATHGGRRAVQRGNDLLDRLDEIRHGLLLGAIPIERLKALAVMLRAERARAADPRLAAVVDEIELRCAVELAKLGQHANI